ncbi:hypothetical protein [Bartonella sp. B39]
MVKIFKNYALSILIAYAFFLSQIVSVNANHLKNGHQKEVIAGFLMEQVGNASSQAVTMVTFYAPILGYEVKNGDTVEGKIEKIVEPITVGTGILIAGHVVSFISAVIGWIKDILLMIKQHRSV